MIQRSGTPSPLCAAEPPEDVARRPRVLVIEDEAGVRELVCEFLQVVGCEATGAATGAEGLTLFSRASYDLVVTDVVMPGLTGWEVVTAVRRVAPEMGIILMTGTATDVDARRAHELGLTLVRKPFRLEELQEAVEQRLTLGARQS